VHSRVEINSLGMMGLSEQNECIGWALDLGFSGGGRWARWNKSDRADGSTRAMSLLLELIVPDSNVAMWTWLAKVIAALRNKEATSTMGDGGVHSQTVKHVLVKENLEW